MAADRSRSRVKTVERTFEILDALKELDGAGIAELAAHTGLVNSTIHRHLTTLEDLGFVTKEADHTYYISLGFLDYGEYARTRKPVYRLAVSKVNALAAETKERCQFVVEENGYGVYVYVANGANAVETNSRVGTKLYLHSTSVGQAILAHLPRERVDEILDEVGLPQLTEQTICETETLHERLERVREEDIAYNEEENVQGLRSIGAPIVHDGTVLGAISVSGPTHRMRRNQFNEKVSQLVLGAANEIELKLKYP